MSLDLTLTFDGHRVRMLGTPEHPAFVAKDVCRVLGIHSTANALQNAGVTAEENAHAHVAPDPAPGSPPPLRRAEDRAAYGPIEDQAEFMAIRAAFDHCIDSGDHALSFAVVSRICKAFKAHLKMHGGSL
jgi:hypothetical protein